jgi:8-oxo-dGTP pyrophosphatase MutT (NUDIX family)
VEAIVPFDDLEAGHRSDVLAWIDAGAPLWRTAKPATPPKHLVSYAAVVDCDADRVLLADHRLSGRWLPAGGHVEPGEHPTAAAQRELVEELGVEPPLHPASAAVPVLVTVTTTVGADGGHDDVSLWYAFTASGETTLRPDAGELAEVRWWPIDDVRHGPGTRFDPHLPRFLAKLSAGPMYRS